MQASGRGGEAAPAIAQEGNLFNGSHIGSSRTCGDAGQPPTELRGSLLGKDKLPRAMLVCAPLGPPAVIRHPDRVLKAPLSSCRRSRAA